MPEVIDRLEDHIRYLLPGPRQQGLEAAMRAAAVALRAAEVLATAMETCHVCSAQLLIDESSVHCEDCPSGCEHHDAPNCVPIGELHRQLKAALNVGRPVDAD
jgi:hypothetical protein